MLDGNDENFEKNLSIGWHGKCRVHDQFTLEDIAAVRKQYPDVVVLAHPECPPQIVEASDFSGSTSRMINYVKRLRRIATYFSRNVRWLTTSSLKILKRNVLRLCSVRCPHMAQITLEDTLKALEEDCYEVTLRARDELLALVVHRSHA